jgi:hypothetical protein
MTPNCGWPSCIVARTEGGNPTMLDAVSQRDRFQQFVRTARELLADFREVEENFRGLDRTLREQIAGWAGSKGALLDEALSSRASIAESDQGRSFRAFYDFLLSYQKQNELTDLLERLQHIDGLDSQGERLHRVHYDWIDASERTQATVRLLSDQLRRFLDDQVWLENRRVFELLRSIEGKALRFRNQSELVAAMELDDTGVTATLPMERPLYHRARSNRLDAPSVEHGDNEFDASALLDQLYVDREELRGRVFDALDGGGQVGLSQVVRETPLEQGLAELIGYLSLDDPGLEIIFDEERRDSIRWNGGDVERRADLPAVTYVRDGSDSA